MEQIAGCRRRDKRSAAQLQVSAVHTPAAVPVAPLMLRSTKLPAGTGTLPNAVQGAPGDTVQVSAVSAILPGAPTRSVTVIVFVCWEKTFSAVAVHPAGTQVNADAGCCTVPISVALDAGPFTE